MCCSLNVNLGLGGDLNINQQNVANALNNFFNAGGALPAGFLPVFNLTGGNLQNALTQLSGEANVDGQAVTFQQMTQFLGLMLDPFVAGRNGVGGGAGALGFAPNRRRISPPTSRSPITLSSRRRRQNRDIGSALDRVGHGLRRQRQDQRRSRRRLEHVHGEHFWLCRRHGLSPGAGHDPRLRARRRRHQLDPRAGDRQRPERRVPGRRLWHQIFRAGLCGVSLAVANNWMTTIRTALGDQITSSFNAQSVGGRVEAGYRYAVQPAIGVTPYGALQAQSFHTPSRSEIDLTGGALD